MPFLAVPAWAANQDGHEEARDGRNSLAQLAPPTLAQSSFAMDISPSPGMGGLDSFLSFGGGYARANATPSGHRRSAEMFRRSGAVFTAAGSCANSSAAFPYVFAKGAEKEATKFATHPILHTFAGSIHATLNSELGIKMLYGLALAPRSNEIKPKLPLDHESSNQNQHAANNNMIKIWDKEHSKGLVLRDGFVPHQRSLPLGSKNREEILANLLGNRTRLDFHQDRHFLSTGLPASSPVRFLLELFTKGRHLTHELEASPMGQVLGYVGS
ncbi:unnamed protein product [Amoebophrya sp. A25]|nr:unnamed protein product [Amoebophrya sp. A25]|eukprot:GSA25T00024923001.1